MLKHALSMLYNFFISSYYFVVWLILFYFHSVAISNVIAVETKEHMLVI